jgi:hypothetical protein
MVKVSTRTLDEAACVNLFGAHPEDVVTPIKSAADALGWLEEIFKTIQYEALKERNGHRIQQLAAAGSYLAADMGNYAGCQYETMIERLRKASVVPTDGGAL